MTTIDMTTTEGLVEHLQTLPSANLEAIAARPIWNAESAVLVIGAGMVLDARRIKDAWSCKDCSGRECDCAYECAVCGAKSVGSPNYCGCTP